MGVALGYRTEKKLTPEEKAKKAATEKILRANRLTKTKEYMKAKKEKRDKKREVRKARLARKKAAGTLKERKVVPKADRKRKVSKPKERKLDALSSSRKQRAEQQKASHP